MKRYCLILVGFAFFSGISFAQKASVPDIRMVEKDRKVEVLVDGQLFTAYIYPEDIMKPVLWPIVSSQGNAVTRHFPLEKVAGERVDHPHHVGLWLNFGDVNGLDFWNNSTAIPAEKKNQYGSIVHQSVDKVKPGKGHGKLDVSAQWKAPDGAVLLQEKTCFTFTAAPRLRIIDRRTTLTAVADKVVFTDNKEGTLGLRVARSLELPEDKPVVLTDSKGNITEVKAMNSSDVTGNYCSSDNIQGDAVWGTRGRWMKLTGRVNDEPVTLVIIDHPKNVNYPTYWHARGYGLFAANPLGQSIFTEGKSALNLTLKKDESVTFNYRIVIYSGDLSRPQIEDYIARFVRMN